MYTRCPACSTCFRVTDRHLAIAKGKVRCGQCQLVFNAPEHAIEDLPTTPAAVNNTQALKPDPIITPTQTSVAEISPPVPDDNEENIIEIKVAPDEETTNEEETLKQPLSEEPVFESDATLIADADSTVNNEDEFEEIKHKSHSATQEINNEIDDKLLNDDFDLDAAINDFTETTEEENILEEAVKEQDIPENKKHDVFTTDAYDATSASSVADIMNEMEGQLSLKIPEPNYDEEYDANKEFDFLHLEDNTETNHSEKNSSKDNIIDEFTFIENDDDELNEDINEAEEENTIDEDELFDQIDLSDFQDEDNNDENIVLEAPSFENNIGKHAKENDDSIPFQLRDDIRSLQTSSSRRWHPLLSFSLIIVLLIISGSQLAFFRAHELVKLSPATRPLLEAFCENIGCHYSGPRDIKQIQLISRDVRLHPKEKNALLISAAMINNAHFAQPYPDIHIRLSDISGNVIAERIFNAKTYMGKLSNPFLLMKSKTPVHINFEVVDPGKDAVNFEFTFL